MNQIQKNSSCGKPKFNGWLSVLHLITFWCTIESQLSSKNVLYIEVSFIYLINQPFGERCADARLMLLYCAILGKSYSLLQCPCSCHFLVCALLCWVGKLKEYKNTQPLIGMPEPLPETGVLANHSSRKFERNE